MNRYGNLPPGCTDRHVDEASPGYGEEPHDEGPEDHNLVQCDNCLQMFNPDEDEDSYLGPTVHGDTAQCGTCIQKAKERW